MKWNVYEMITDIKSIGFAEEIKPGEIHIKLKDKTLILLEEKTEDKKQQINVKHKYSVRNGYFENDITKKVKKIYSIGFKEKTLKELSQILNGHYQNIISPSALREKIKPILEKNGYATNMKDAVPAYIKYFTFEGLLKKNKGVFEIVRSNLIPKKEKESRGFLDELGMS